MMKKIPKHKVFPSLIVSYFSYTFYSSNNRESKKKFRNKKKVKRKKYQKKGVKEKLFGKKGKKTLSDAICY